MRSDRPGLELSRDGAQLAPGAATALIDALESVLAGQAGGRAGVRLFGNDVLRPMLAATGPIGKLAAATLGPATRPVRAILFDKSAAANWALPWHQDRVVAVKARRDIVGFGPWTRKHGALHVAPPFEILASMVTLRAHLDPTPAENAPLLVAPGSHRLGRVAEPDVRDAVKRCGVHACLAAAGDVWLYATPILHASERPAHPTRRRVLQIDYAAIELPGGLEWLGV